MIILSLFYNKYLILPEYSIISLIPPLIKKQAHIKLSLKNLNSLTNTALIKSQFQNSIIPPHPDITHLIQ